ncbi:MAG: helix-turn-helix protein [Rhodobacteraceae bacterium HLUCCA12]|nr:MAG: helix-turn-helix protein [Rhodobacteraceae bacterium HLUCCA12]
MCLKIYAIIVSYQLLCKLAHHDERHGIRREQEWRGLHQEQLAFVAALNRAYVSRVERGVRNPTVITVAKLAVVLGAEPYKLL